VEWPVHGEVQDRKADEKNKSIESTEELAGS
jgi:hypothetical protein